MSDHPIASDALTQELQRIRELIGKGQLQAAAQALNAAQRQAPHDARVYLLGMRLASFAGNVGGAIQSARRALALAPNWPVAMLELGALLARGNGKQEAMRLAREAVAQNPNDPLVLTNAANISHTSGDKEQALKWMQQGATQHPDDARLRLALAQILAELNRHAEAKPHFDWLETRLPGDHRVLLGQLNCALSAKDVEAARRYADLALAALPEDSHVQYWHAITHGRTPPTRPAAAVASLFERYADHYDSLWAHDLQYRVPERIAQILDQLHPERRFNLLDLGCGTGFVGACLGPIDGHIVGVDLSGRMIEQAQQRGVYSKFYKANLLDALRDTPADHYEAITCADVLVYVGDLGLVIPGAKRVLKPGGHFIFSCEAAQDGEPDLILRPSNRYAHRDTAAERLCREAGFTDIRIDQLPVLRMEGGQPLPGFLVTARKPA
ncbi:MAG: methyltransferase domain-containing protein [Burkholderiaceae bacterium]|jgi:predicted TPR repeat methyltransferase|nr:methyltransferase domain-containing protein [Burkholderiaceae bacterium]